MITNIFLDVFRRKYRTGITISASTQVGSYEENCDIFVIGDAVTFSNEEDTYNSNIVNDNKTHFLAVLDGMNGEPRGREAARCGAQALLESPPKKIGDGTEVLMNAGKHVEKEVRGSGTTLSLLIWNKNTYEVINAGDSPIYLLRNGVLSHLSEDHSLAGQKRLAGMEPFPGDDSYLLSFLGCGVEDKTWSPITGPIYPGDKFLLCSDGITKSLSEKQIRRMLKKDKKPAEKIVSSATRRKGSDNCTAIVMSVGGE